MTRKSQLFGAMLLALAPSASLAVPTSPVAWVSKQFGNDAAGCGAVTNPCRTFQYALDNVVVAGGTIAVRDAGGYGPLTISKSIAIINQSAGIGGIFGPPDAAILIQAGASDVVLIKGLTLEGSGTGETGIRARSVGKLVIANCNIKSFRHSSTSAGVDVQPISGAVDFSLTDSLITGNSYAGVNVQPNPFAAVSGLISNVTITKNPNGLFAQSANNGPIKISIADSVLTHNDFGLFTFGNLAVVAAARINASQNDYGAAATSQAEIDLSFSALTNNKTVDAFSNGAAVIKSYGNNDIRNSSTLTPASLK
ncbi:hypothetical protein [Methylocystis parvus]|uniref:hypothetical protein n=1 Tax=Methylocystis parvus TaxID=134 RepID=UPI003C70A4A5